MQKLTIGTILVAFMIALSGCSAMIVATGTNEEDIVKLGSSKDSVTMSLGMPIRTEELPEPIQIQDIKANHYHEVAVFEQKLDEESKFAVEKSYYKYVGEIQGKHDVGEIVSANLMTFGIAELFALPAAIGDRATRSEHLFEIWFNSEGIVVAYKRTELQN